jgi:hypothetical protein
MIYLILLAVFLVMCFTMDNEDPLKIMGLIFIIWGAGLLWAGVI